MPHLPQSLHPHVGTSIAFPKNDTERNDPSDLLKRHVAGHASPGKESSSRPDNSTPSRVTKACRTCASNHLRCTETKPCSRCVEKGLDCVWYNQPDDSDRDSADEEEDTIMRSDPGPQSDSVVHTDDNGTVSVDPIIDMVDAAAGDHSQYVSRPEDARPMAGPPTATSGIFSPVPTLLQPHSEFRCQVTGLCSTNNAVCHRLITRP